MAETELPGMQHLAWENVCQFLRIHFVAQNRMAQMMQMNANLVRASTMQAAFDQTDLATGTQDAILRFRAPSTCGCYRHALSMDRVASDFLFDHA